MTYDEWVQEVIRLGELKGLRVYYFEEEPRWGKRIGTFVAYCGETAVVHAGAGEDLIGPAVFTSPAAFTEYWPVCQKTQEVIEQVPDTEYELKEWLGRTRRCIDINAVRVAWRGLSVLFFGPPAPPERAGVIQ